MGWCKRVRKVYKSIGEEIKENRRAYLKFAVDLMQRYSDAIADDNLTRGERDSLKLVATQNVISALQRRFGLTTSTAQVIVAIAARMMGLEVADTHTDASTQAEAAFAVSRDLELDDEDEALDRLLGEA